MERNNVIGWLRWFWKSLVRSLHFRKSNSSTFKNLQTQIPGLSKTRKSPAIRQCLVHRDSRCPKEMRNSIRFSPGISTTESAKYCRHSAAHCRQKHSECSALSSPLPQQGKTVDQQKLGTRLHMWACWASNDELLFLLLMEHSTK